MDNSAYSFELERLKKNGIAALNEMISGGYQENFYLDFKEISTQENSRKLTDNDRKNFAKAISGFSNTSGGLIIWGVRDNRNNTFTQKPVSNPEFFVGLLNNVVSSLSMPIMTGINSFVIKDGDKGCIVTEVPKYFFSPVQVNPLLNSQPTSEIIGRYYIRSGSDFVLANHDIITSLYNRNRQSEIIYSWTDGHNSYGETDDEIVCHTCLVLQNKGNGILRDIWVNYAANRIRSKLEKTVQTDNFTGSDFFKHALNLITKDGYKMGPQQSLTPFLLEIRFSKSKIEDDAYIYISFGSDNTSPKQIKFLPTQEKLDLFLQFPREQRNFQSFVNIFLAQQE